MIQLTNPQKRIAELLLAAQSNAEIAEALEWSEGAVKNELGRMLDLSGMDDRASLAIWLHEHRATLQISCPCDWGMEAVESVPSKRAIRTLSEAHTV